MSTLHKSNLLHSHSTTQDLATIAAMLQEAGEALVAFSSENKPSSVFPVDAVKPPNTKQAYRKSGETRVYYFPFLALSHEKGLLRKYGTNDMQSLLGEVYSRLSAVTNSMKSVNSDKRIRGKDVATFGRILDEVAWMVSQIRVIYSTAERIQ